MSSTYGINWTNFSNSQTHFSTFRLAYLTHSVTMAGLINIAKTFAIRAVKYSTGRIIALKLRSHVTPTTLIASVVSESVACSFAHTIKFGGCICLYLRAGVV